MKKSIVFISVLISVFALASCTGISESTLVLEAEKESFHVLALNANAKKALIPFSGKNRYMFFAFDDAFPLFLEQEDKSLALCLDIFFPENLPSKNKNSKNIDKDSSLQTIGLGFLTEDDFTIDGKLKEGVLASRSMVEGNLRIEDFKSGLSLSFAFPTSEVNGKKIKGFFVYATDALQIEKANIQRPSLGWSYVYEKPFFAFSSMGGKIPQSLSDAQEEGLSLALSQSLGLDPKESFLSLGFVPQEPISKPNRYPSIVFSIGSEQYTIQRSPFQTKTHIYTSQMLSPSADLYCDSNKNLLTEIIYKSNEGFSKKVSTEKSLTPLYTDPGMIIIWDQNTWRQDEYELFSWDLFPSVLIMDFKNYKVQDDYLKRLAFFAEKKGYTGRLQADAIIKNQHGFNAHDYSADTLANFFALADIESFPLNQSELHLRSILLENNILTFQNGKIVAGEGALLSISQESYLALRYTLMGHESYHGIYFTQKAFRDYVLEVYNASDLASRDFLIGYFTTSESLNYDIDDDYLLKNEFMAYLLQQSISNTGQYFVNIASRPTVSRDLPELSFYVRNTRGAGFTDACRELDAFIYREYGLEAGRVRLVSKN